MSLGWGVLGGVWGELTLSLAKEFGVKDKDVKGKSYKGRVLSSSGHLRKTALLL